LIFFNWVLLGKTHFWIVLENSDETHLTITRFTQPTKSSNPFPELVEGNGLNIHGRQMLASLLHRAVDENKTVTSLQGAGKWLNL
jgi:hypothetical protein